MTYKRMRNFSFKCELKKFYCGILNEKEKDQWSAVKVLGASSFVVIGQALFNLHLAPENRGGFPPHSVAVVRGQRKAGEYPPVVQP